MRKIKTFADVDQYTTHNDIMESQLYWRYIAPNEPGRLPRSTPRRINRRAQAKTYPRDIWVGHGSRVRSWRRGVWA